MVNSFSSDFYCENFSQPLIKLGQAVLNSIHLISEVILGLID